MRYIKKMLKDLYGSGILFFYFFKWPYALGYPWLYFHGLDNNFILDGLWFYTIFLIIKDFVTLLRKRKNG